MTIPTQLNQLIERFRDNLPDYKAGKYNETQVRREFIDPLFKLLGWDIDNEKGYAEAYKEVVHEDAIKVGQATKAPDYSFRIGGSRKFFLEAKKPSVNIKEDTHPAYQLRRYAWSAKLPLSILTDFEEFAVYDCRVQPNKADRAAAARIMYFTYDQYPAQWDTLLNIFSSEAIRKGAFDRFADSNKAKRGTAEVDSVFLQEIERWRDSLARNLALRNNLNQRQLNFAVQRIIDRLIFLRIAEDRGLEPYGQLRDLTASPALYPRLLTLFGRADDRYNSGLFHFKAEKGRPEEPDHLTPTLALDDKILKDIFKNIYYPDSPYEFSVLSADILGQVYEQFLGKVIRLSPGGHRAEVEDKPEVKKAGGVYYTPTYIVEYIVRQTVGKLLEDKKPDQVEFLKIVDPACGSGSFLLGAYQFLLDWYRDRYIEDNPGKWAKGRQPRLYQSGGEGGWKLTMTERKRILLNHIYGVDIDPQAVEVTKLSLLLRVLEDEKSLSPQLELIQERVLPDLGDNIKCGNSLIGPDFYSGQQLALFDEEEMHRVNAFDWQAEFPAIMRAGGFDVVIGNPPYIRIQAMKEWAPKEVEFYKQKYVAASKGNYDIYVVFVEKGLSLLNNQGSLGFILPHKFFNAQYGEALRDLLAKGRHLNQVIHFGDQQIFANATTYTCLLFLNKQANNSFQIVKVSDLPAWWEGNPQNEGVISAESAKSGEWNFVIGSGSDLFERLNKMPTKLRDVAERMGQGIRTSANEVFVLDLVSENGDLIEARSIYLNKVVILEKNSTALFLQGREIKPFYVIPSGKIVIMPYRVENNRAKLIPENDYRDSYPNAYNYLRQTKTYLEKRERGKIQKSGWYAYGRLQNLDLMLLPKILVPDIASQASFALDSNGKYAFTSGYGITLKDETSESFLYILGLLNSSVLDFYLKRVSTTLRGGFFRYFTQYIEQLPIRLIDFTNPADKTRHERMVALVEQMLSLHQRLVGESVPQTRTVIQRQIEATDREIDRLVYELYGLNDEEIRIVEGEG